MILLQSATVQITRSETVFEIIMKGGWILAPIALLSLLAIYYMIERYTLLLSVKDINQEVIDKICVLLRQKKHAEALEMARSYNHPAGKIIAVGIDTPGRDAADVEKIMADEAKSETFVLEKHMSFIGIVAAIAPMFGFLGTIFGVIKIFYNISLADNISIGIIAGGLYQKMISSAAGLTVGIVAYAGYYYLNTMIDGIVNRLEKSLNKVIIAYKES